MLEVCHTIYYTNMIHKVYIMYIIYNPCISLSDVFIEVNKIRTPMYCYIDLLLESYKHYTII